MQLANEKGGVLVMVTIWLPVLVLFVMFVLETGNWFVHKRHLQVQADAAAFAGGAMFSDCFTPAGGGDATIFNEASKYAGQAGSFQGASYGTALHNDQIGNANRGSVSVLYQSKTYAAESPAPDDTETEGPCSTPSLMFDVKATEADLPLYFGNFIPGLASATINAHARVQLRTVESQSGLLPIAVPDVRFNYAFATFIDETTGATLATTQLQKAGTSGGQQLWSTSSNVDVAISSPHVGVRIRLVGGTDANAGCDQLYVECYDAESANGAVHIRGWDPDGGTPAVRDAWLLAGTCAPDAYFATGDCSAGVQANVDLGPLYPLTGDGVTAEVSASVDGGGKHVLTPGRTSGTVTWTLGNGLPVAGDGPHAVSLAWSWEKTEGTWNGKTCNPKNNNPCKDGGPFGVVQRAFVASPERSGSLQGLQLSNGAFSSGANSFEYGTTSLGVTIAVTGNLSVQSAATDPVVELRVVGSQNQSIDCDPNKPNLKDEIATGCEPSYVINPSLACPAYNELWTNVEQPWPCVKTQTGNAAGQVPQGLEQRIFGGSSSCTAPNNWPNYSSDDPRIVPLIITPFGTFGGSGNDIVPVIDFAAFYVVGWGGPGGDPCPGSVPVPKGYIAGHFIKYVPPNSTATGGAVCDPKAITPCVAVLTR
jgi:Putative Flp pilus-assembly TadE/G-like